MRWHKPHLAKPLLKTIPLLILALEVGLFARGSNSAPQTQPATQLNQNCTISVLNRTSNVQPDGGWRIDNIPANFGSVRARATCVEDGMTRSGQSDLFNIETNAVTGFNDQIPIG